MSAKNDGPGIANGGTGVLSVDGKDVATLKVLHTIPFLLPADERFDVGSDTRTPVDDKDYRMPFQFTSLERQIVNRHIAMAKDFRRKRDNGMAGGTSCGAAARPPGTRLADNKKS